MNSNTSGSKASLQVDVAVITGTGGMGMACARRLGSGRRLVLADFDTQRLADAQARLTEEGFDVRTQQVDVADRASVARLAQTVADAGHLRVLLHTAGLSPTMAETDRILAVDLAGTAYVLDNFLPLAQAGTVAVVIASMAGHSATFTAEIERSLAQLPADELCQAVAKLGPLDSTQAYALAKRGNLLRVEACAPAWGAVGARVVSVSPGIISTPMAQQERRLQPIMEHMLKISPLQRIGTPEDIASLVEWLSSPAASFITGTDIRIDGGVIAALRNA